VCVFEIKSIENINQQTKTILNENNKQKKKMKRKKRFT